MTLLHQLDTLESAGLLVLAQQLPELEYLFRHALVQEATYHTLVKQDRKHLHRIVGEALEHAHPDRTDQFAPLLARHFFESGDEGHAFKYFVLAGDNAARVYANAEAIVFYTHAAEIAQRLVVNSEQLIQLYTRLGRVYEVNGQYERALDTYRRMQSLARSRNDRVLELSALMSQATILATPTPLIDPPQGQMVLEQALELARDLGDRAGEAKIFWNWMLLSYFRGMSREGIRYGERSLAIARALDLHEQLAYTLNDLSHAYHVIGDDERAQAVLDEARSLWRELGNMPMLADNLSASSHAALYRGHYDQAIALSDEAFRLSQSIANSWGQCSSRFIVGFAYMELGLPDKAIKVIEEAIRISEQVGHAGVLIATRSDLAWFYGSLGAFDEALRIIHQALAKAQNQFVMLRTWSLSVLARLHLLRGEIAEAESAISEGRAYLNPEISLFAPYLLVLADAELAFAKHDYALSISIASGLVRELRQAQMHPYQTDALYVQARSLLAIHQATEAETVLLEAKAEAEAIHSRRMLWPILIALSEIESAQGHQAEAQALCNEARAVVTYIAEHTPPALRTSWLNLPDVRAALGEA